MIEFSQLFSGSAVERFAVPVERGCHCVPTHERNESTYLEDTNEREIS